MTGILFDESQNTQNFALPTQVCEWVHKMQISYVWFLDVVFISHLSVHHTNGAIPMLQS